MVTVIENEEEREGTRVIRRKILRTDDPKFPSGYRYALHYGHTDDRGTILRYLENLRFSTTRRNGIAVPRRQRKPDGGSARTTYV